MSGLLKRKFEEVDEERCYSSPSSLSSSAYSGWDSEGESCYSDTLDSTPSNPGSPITSFSIPSDPLTFPSRPATATSILKKAKRPRRGNVTFDQVTVFSFARCQGFTSVPSRGGCSLGMVQRHCHLRTYTLAEFAAEQRLLRREKVLDRLRQEKLEALRLKLTKNGTQDCEAAARLTVDDLPEEEEGEEQKAVEADPSGANPDEGSSSSFLHPYASKQRHALLKAAGVKKIDKEEKRQLHELRLSREKCGCDCQGFCEPETCGCSLAGIKCQMDHSSFPCGCTKDGCGNMEGRIEFNSTRVQTHYIHTIMKLELEKKLEEHSGTEEDEEEEAAALVTTEAHLVTTAAATATPPPCPALTGHSENSCSSDMTDSSEAAAASPLDPHSVGRQSGEHQVSLDMDDRGLSHILSFSDPDNETCCWRSSKVPGEEEEEEDVVGKDHLRCRQQQQPFGSAATSPVVCSDGLLDSADDYTDNQAKALSELLDENANQGNALFHGGGCVPRTPSPSFDRSANYDMDLSLSSESDLEFFDGFPCLGCPSSLYNSLKEYEHMDNFFQFQLPSYPSLPQASDPGTSLLESLIGLSESVPEPPATFTDNQLLEEAMKLSVMESVKV
ncbi:hypothetical protein CRUP_000078 [Coryphaenoides rupestris]|nr:hypothetical protein CRUP_000078 [Coryphaenoides rupestris]